jgi:uncharacterized protein (DUF2235 family)
MALYAFDGTWNDDSGQPNRRTNVSWFRDAYLGAKHYEKGVGTRLGKTGRVLGGITGAGGRTRVAEALRHLGEHFKSGDEVIDIVGFSRGAALALHFANAISSDGVPGVGGTRGVAIRFLGLWDTVPSFGVPGSKNNIGWNLGLPDNVTRCYHALALDERRRTFRLHRLEARVEHADQDGRLFELWFRGVHSDVGGGNTNTGLSSIALDWMLARAAASGLPIDAQVVEANRALMAPDTAVAPSPRYDLIKDPFRIVRWNDQVHRSVAARDRSTHNNPPAGVEVRDNQNNVVGRFGE